MKALIQRVTHAKVTVAGQTVGEIEQGILAYVGIGHDDDLAKGKKLIDKILTYRIFEDPNLPCDDPKAGKLDCHLGQVGGGLLLVSQFTLMARTRKGRRPDFTDAMPPNDAKPLFEQVCDYAYQSHHHKVATGEFGANMQVSAVNDGPLNFLLEV